MKTETSLKLHLMSDSEPKPEPETTVNHYTTAYQQTAEK